MIKHRGIRVERRNRCVLFDIRDLYRWSEARDETRAMSYVPWSKTFV